MKQSVFPGGRVLVRKNVSEFAEAYLVGLRYIWGDSVSFNHYLTSSADWCR